LKGGSLVWTIVPTTKTKKFFAVTDDEKWIYYYNPKRKKSWVSPAMHQPSRQRRIFMPPSLCSVFGGISRVSRTTSCTNLTKPLQWIGIDFNDAFKPNIEKNTVAIRAKTRLSYSPAWQCLISYRIDRQNILANAEMGNLISSTVFSWYCPL